MKAFLITWLGNVRGQLFDRQLLLNALDKIPDVVNWRAAIGAVFVVSNATPVRLREQIHAALPDLQFVITPIDIQTIEGWADKETWDFVRRPRRVGQP
jgi:hypothetical protein